MLAQRRRFAFFLCSRQIVKDAMHHGDTVEDALEGAVSVRRETSARVLEDFGKAPGEGPRTSMVMPVVGSGFDSVLPDFDDQGLDERKGKLARRLGL
jgi:hypothetical protein